MVARLVAFLFLAGCLFSSALYAADPLAVSKDLAASKYKDWQYGSDPGKKQVDCVQFLLSVVEESVGAPLVPNVRNRILIAELSEAEKKHPILGTLVVNGDERIKGVQSALVDASLGTAVPVADAAPGDLIQYWMKKSDGTWFGHAGVIESVDRTGVTPKARIFGAHASPKPGNIGTSSFDLKLIDGTDDRKIYLVRVK
jgi:hypothetical protein